MEIGGRSNPLESQKKTTKECGFKVSDPGYSSHEDYQDLELWSRIACQTLRVISYEDHFSGTEVYILH